MKVLFLDVDGVLNTRKTVVSAAKRATQKIPEWPLDKPCLEQLERIIRETGCKVVISSAWRNHSGPYKTLQDCCKGQCIGKTPHLPSHSRDCEIREWLFDKIVHHAVLDDGISADLFDGSFFKTSLDGGLTEAIANSVIDYLNKENS